MDVLNRGVAGDYVECGVYRGGSSAAVGMAWRETKRQMWLYDSFQGMPEPSRQDGDLARQFVGQGAASPDQVREALRLAGFPAERARIIEGMFDESFRQATPSQVALLHVDCDWYESVLLSLRTFYDRVSEGGIVVLDDFGHWEGAREAFYKYVHERGEKPLLERFGHTQTYWVKGKRHNRDEPPTQAAH